MLPCDARAAKWEYYLMRSLLSTIVATLILLLIPTPLPTWAQTQQQNLTPIQIQTLTETRYSLTTVDDLQLRGIVSDNIAKSQKDYYLRQAQTAIGSPLTREQLTALLEDYSSRPLADTQVATQQLAGFFTFINIIWVASSILLVIAIGWLTNLYLVPILRSIPAGVYEILIYAACLIVIIGGKWFETGIAEYIALLGCLGLVGALLFTNYLHWSAFQRFCSQSKVDIPTLNSLALFLVWTPVAIIYNSSLIAFIAVIALEVFLGFSVLVIPLCYFIGFRERQVIPSATTASFFMFAFYVVVKIARLDIPYLNIFSSGALFMGTFVYFVGLLILSCKWYRHNDFWQYALLQLVTITSGVLALLIGSVWQIYSLEGIGGTFFFLYLLEKYLELPWQRHNWAWATLGLAVMLYLSSFIIRQYPQYFLLGS